MDAICLNTLTGAATEYEGFAFQSVTPDYAGNVNGLFQLGGDTDNGQPIGAEFKTGRLLWADNRKKLMDCVWFSMWGDGEGELIVTGDQMFRYRFPVRSSGQSRAIPGKGIRENYLAFGFANVDGADFQIDRIEVLARESATRRV